MALQPPAPPLTVALEDIGERLDEDQKQALAKWQKQAETITRSNNFKVHETEKYKRREDLYRAVLDEQRQHNASTIIGMRQELEYEKHLAMQPMAWGKGYNGFGNGKTLAPLSLSMNQYRHASSAVGVPLSPNLQEALVGLQPSQISRWIAPVSIVMPEQRKLAPGRLRTLRFSKKQLRAQAEKTEILVPIRLDLDADGYRLRDTFTWDMNNELISSDRFARSLCIDVGLPQELFVPMIVQAIEEQVDDFRQYGYTAETSSESLKRSLKAADDASNSQELAEGDELAWVDDELRVVIRIDVLVGHIALRDQFEWDIAPLLRPLVSKELRDSLCADDDDGDDAQVSSRTDKVADEDSEVPLSPTSQQQQQQKEQPEKKSAPDAFSVRLRSWVDGALVGSVTPEQVASVLCAEKGLGGEFETAITHSIREQLYAFVKSFLLAGYTYRPRLVPTSALDAVRLSAAIDDRDLAKSILPPVKSALRDSSMSQTFEPLIVQLHTIDVERLEKDTDRDTRRKRRQGRGRGRTGVVALPDRDVHRTSRSILALPSWFDDELPQGTRSFVHVPGEGAHFLDNYEIRANHEAMAMRGAGNSDYISATLASLLPGMGASNSQPGDIGGGSLGLFHDGSGLQGMQGSMEELGTRSSRRFAGLGSPSMGTGSGLGSPSSMTGGNGGAGGVGGYRSSSSMMMMGMSSMPPPPPPPVLSPRELAMEQLRNPTGRPRGRPSILEKALRDASAARSMRLEKSGERGFRQGAIPGMLTGRPLEELKARWRCMRCGLTPDCTPLIRRGPDSMHTLCDDCGQMYAETR
ncbi:SWI/SNF chromatin-remodeling complex subunit, partial [Linderina macrospora]